MQFLAGGNIHIGNLEKIISTLGYDCALVKTGNIKPFEKRLRVDRKKLTRFCKDNDIASVSLFGSVLRNDFSKDSDVDVMIRIKKPITFFELADIEDGLKKILNTKHKLDIVTDEGLSPLIKLEVEKSKEVIYAETA